jgi:hypothetical protein
MNTQSIHEFFEKLKDDSLSFLYHGFISDEFTTKIIRIIENNIEKNDEPKVVRNKVSYLIAESFQNIFRHGVSTEKERYSFNKPGFFGIRVLNESYVISTANLINNTNIESIEEKLIQLKSLDKEQLKALHNEVLGSLEISDKGGAGLGLIDMARKTNNELEYAIEKVNDIFSFFYFQLIFNPKLNENTSTPNVPISFAKELHERMDQDNTYLFYKGDFSQDNVLTLLKIIERNLQINPFESESLKSLIYLILTELLQNISKHAFSHNNKKIGAFLIGKHFNKYILSTGNYVENSKIKAFEENIKSLNSKNKKELQELYIDTIKNGYIDSLGNSGLGFIQIVKESNEITYNTYEVNDEYSFLTLSINI